VPVYLAGARVETLYPMSVITGGMALNITCVSYAEKLDFGLTLDPDVIDHAWSLMDAMERELAAYLSGVPGKPGSGKKTPPRKKAPKGSKARRRR
jgi:hypothetical protein